MPIYRVRLYKLLYLGTESHSGEFLGEHRDGFPGENLCLVSHQLAKIFAMLSNNPVCRCHDPNGWRDWRTHLMCGKIISIFCRGIFMNRIKTEWMIYDGRRWSWDARIVVSVGTKWIQPFKHFLSTHLSFFAVLYRAGINLSGESRRPCRVGDIT